MIDAPDVIDPDVIEEADNEQEPIVEAAGTKKKRARDFTKFTEMHQELANYVNQNSGIDAITPQQVKALLTLRIDFMKLPEQIARREQRKLERKAEKTKYDGMSPEQIKGAKAAERAEKHAAKLEARVAAARAKVEELRLAATATGSDLAAAVEAAQQQTTQEEIPTTGSSTKRKLGRRR